MPIHIKKKFHPALKHGGYATTALLPGEDAAAFEKLLQGLVAELTPSGELENDIVATMARLVWRKRNLLTFYIAELARQRCCAISSEVIPSNSYNHFPLLDDRDPGELAKANQAATDQARNELGDM